MYPFVYPAEPLRRRHGPGGYATYESYRPWLRDEFLFRCVLCLRREQWTTIRGDFHIDHFIPRSTKSERTLSYDNLIYSCASCNLGKGKLKLPPLGETMLAGSVRMYRNRAIQGDTVQVRRTIRIFGLDRPAYRHFRASMIAVAQLARKLDRDLFHRLMKFPEDLPNLAAMRPPENTRPDGVEQSCWARRERGDLPTTY